VRFHFSRPKNTGNAQFVISRELVEWAWEDYWLLVTSDAPLQKKQNNIQTLMDIAISLLKNLIA